MFADREYPEVLTAEWAWTFLAHAIRHEYYRHEDAGRDVQDILYEAKRRVMGLH